MTKSNIWINVNKKTKYESVYKKTKKQGRIFLLKPLKKGLVGHAFSSHEEAKKSGFAKI